LLIGFMIQLSGYGKRYLVVKNKRIFKLINKMIVFLILV